MPRERVPVGAPAHMCMRKESLRRSCLGPRSRRQTRLLRHPGRRRMGQRPNPQNRSPRAVGSVGRKTTLTPIVSLRASASSVEYSATNVQSVGNGSREKPVKRRPPPSRRILSSKRTRKFLSATFRVPLGTLPQTTSLSAPFALWLSLHARISYILVHPLHCGQKLHYGHLRVEQSSNVPKPSTSWLTPISDQPPRRAHSPLRSGHFACFWHKVLLHAHFGEEGRPKRSYRTKRQTGCHHWHGGQHGRLQGVRL